MTAPSQLIQRVSSRVALTLLSFATLALGACDSETVESPSPVVSVAVTPRVSNLSVGGTQQLSAQPLDAAGNPVAGRTITWTSSEPKVATVSASGLVTTVGPGTTAILASADNSTGFAAITSAASVASVAITGNTGVLPVGQSFQLTANARDAAGNELFLRPITWSSSAPTVATVSASGLVTAVAAGTATISAATEGRTGTTTVTAAVLAAPVASVTVAPAAIQLIVGGAPQLTATLRDGAGVVLTDRAVTWSSSNAARATVSSTGLVTTLSQGAVTITASSEGRSGSSTITALNGLLNNSVVSIGAAINTSQFFYVTVPVGTTRLVVSSSAGTGDPDLYLYRPGATPAAPGAVACASEADGPVETCTVNAPAAGLWMVEMFAYSTYAGVQLRAVITP